MREFTKSLGSFSIAMSVFGANQALNLLKQPLPGPNHPATEGFDQVTRAAENKLSGFLKGSFAAGDRLQRSVVDLMFGVATLEVANPNRLVQLSSEVLKQSTAAMTQFIPGSSSSTSEGQADQEKKGGGWGPMPSAG